MHTGGVDERHLTHTDDAHLRTLLHARHDFLKLVGDAKEVRTVDFVHFHILGDGEVIDVGVLGQVGLGSWVNLVVVGEHADLGGLSHAAHAEQASKHETYLDGDGEVEDNGETEGEPKHDDVALRIVHHLTDGAPAAHVVADHYEHARQTCHRDVFGVWHEEEVNQEEHNGVNDAGDRSAAAIVDVGHGAGDGACSGNAAEDGADDVGYALANKLLVGVVLVANDTVGNGGGEKALNGAEHSDGEGGREETLDVVPAECRHIGFGQRGVDFEAVTDGVNVDAEVLGHDDASHSHDNESHKRTGHFLADEGSAGDDDHRKDTYRSGGDVNGAEVLEVANPLLNEVGWHAAFDVETQKVFYLGGEDSEGNTAGEAYDDGVGYVADDGSKTKHAKQDEEEACHNGGDGQACETVLLDDAVDDDDEGSCGTAYLHAATTKGADGKACDDGCEDAFLGRHA